MFSGKDEIQMNNETIEWRNNSDNVDSVDEVQSVEQDKIIR